MPGQEEAASDFGHAQSYLAVGADAEQVLYVTLDKAADYKFTYESGSIENPRINDAIVKILEGSKPAFVQRRLAYQIK